MRLRLMRYCAAVNSEVHSSEYSNRSPKSPEELFVYASGQFFPSSRIQPTIVVSVILLEPR